MHPVSAADGRIKTSSSTCCRPGLLAANRTHPHFPGMFMVTEADATAIQEAFDRAGELAAVVELKQRFRGITDNEQARRCVRSIVGWRTPATSADANHHQAK